MKAISRDIVETLSEYVCAFHADRCVPVTLIGKSCNHAKGTSFGEVIYVREGLFSNIREVLTRIEHGESLVGIKFADSIITSEKQFLLLLVKHCSTAVTEMTVVLQHQFFVSFHFQPTESITFSVTYTNPHWRWWGLKEMPE